jgi:hypothetical protein
MVSIPALFCFAPLFLLCFVFAENKVKELMSMGMGFKHEDVVNALVQAVRFRF